MYILSLEKIWQWLSKLILIWECIFYLFLDCENDQQVGIKKHSKYHKIVVVYVFISLCGTIIDLFINNMDSIVALFSISFIVVEWLNFLLFSILIYLISKLKFRKPLKHWAVMPQFDLLVWLDKSKRFD